MQEKLIIFLHPKDLQHPSWAVLEVKENESRCVYDVYQGNSADLIETATNKEVTVIIPSEDVLLLNTPLPKMNRHRLLQALPFALEDQLIDDVSTLHFAPGEYLKESLPVAVIAKEKMQTWMNLLDSWGIKVHSFIPAIFALPVEENQWQMMVIDGLAIVRLSDFQGFTCDVHNLNPLIQLAFDSQPVEKIIIQNYSKNGITPTLKTPLAMSETHFPPEKLLANLANDISRVPHINLLQGGFSVKKSRFPKGALLWKIAVGLTVSWALILFLYPVVSYFILAKRAHEIDKQIALIYKRNFPNATSVIAPKIRLQEKFQKMMSKGSENRLLLLIAYVGKALDEIASLKIDRMDFQNNQLALQLTANSSDDLGSFSEFLQAKGLSVKQQNADLNGSKINATLLIE